MVIMQLIEWYWGKEDQGRPEKKANQYAVDGIMLGMGSPSLPGFRWNEQGRHKQVIFYLVALNKTMICFYSHNCVYMQGTLKSNISLCIFFTFSFLSYPIKLV